MFEAARLKLTAWYLFIIMLISIFFSAAIYRMVSVEIDRFAHSPRFRFEAGFPDIEDLTTESKNRVILILLEINGIILVISGTFGYILAGRTLAPIQKMLEEQKRFVGDASHELRTPLTALKSMLEVGLRDKKMKLADARQLLNDSLEETDNLTRLANSLLELARETNPQTKNNFQKIKVRDVVDTAIRMVTPKVNQKRQQIVVRTNGATIFGNPEKLVEVLIILLDNAIKYSPHKSIIRIIAKENSRQVTIKVSDRGIGIKPEDLPHIFERFYRADKSRGHVDEGGYGLGLAIAQKIVTEHGGKISVSSVIGHGSEFKVALPLFS